MATQRSAWAGVLTVPFLLLLFAAAVPAQDFSSVEIRTEKVAEGIHALFGRGGNIAVSTGPDGVFMIDDQYAPLTDKIRAAVAAISAAPVRFVLNTHWHGDHTGGNENFGEAGAVLVAHQNVRKRLSSGQLLEFFDRQVPPAPGGALPVVTFTEDLTFHLNGDEISVFHVGPAHTDGDAVVHFKKARVVHMGDTYFNGLYPFIDLSSGGSVHGVIASVDRVLATVDDAARIIPGHGPLSDVSELRSYRYMLATVRDRIQGQIKAGNPLEKVIESRPTAEFDARLGGGFIKPEQFVEIVYRSLAGE
ncbi:MAG: MBL fold metallo-hydrolase [Desulfuromonas sp.]|uniref:MBL fold metallo-hydrolase n=1 Tax=Desulfuromonas sp. TaxID=892 RepID=UPI000CB5CDDE|nr:MBL fold metallo-hydrolase [Desulfuromonas sp.]PLX84204.1 MAG: MBL fold metallo-hydrolase [Desulfuromonas sp.]